MKPLIGMKVLDLTEQHGLATMTLADYGAEVVKVEKPGSGDPRRVKGPLKDGVSLYHAFSDRGKKSITLDIATEEGQELFKGLIKRFDVVVENLNYGKLEEMGLGYDVLSALNPKIILASLNGFGRKGPWRDLPACDLIVQAKSGFLDFTGFPDELPTVIGFPIAEQYSNLFLASAVNAAYFHMLRTGEGQHVWTSLWEGLFAAQEDKMMYTQLGEPPQRWGNAHPELNPNDTLRCKDGYFTLAINSDREWADFCHQFGKPEWAENPDYNEMVARGLNYFNDLRPRLEELMMNFTMEELDRGCRAAKIPAAPVNDFLGAMNEEQLQMRNVVVEVEDSRIGKIKMVGKTGKYHHNNEHDDEIDSAPGLGEHNDVYYKGLLGYDDARLNAWREKGII